MRKRPTEYDAIRRVIDTRVGCAAVPYQVAKHFRHYEWEPGDAVVLRSDGMLACDRQNGWAVTRGLMLRAIQKAERSDCIYWITFWIVIGMVIMVASLIWITRTHS